MTGSGCEIPRYYWNKDKRKRKGFCRICGNVSDFICFKCGYNPNKLKRKEKDDN